MHATIDNTDVTKFFFSMISFFQACERQFTAQSTGRKNNNSAWFVLRGSHNIIPKKAKSAFLSDVMFISDYS